MRHQAVKPLSAILLGESDALALLSALSAAPRIGLCAPNRTELLLVMQTRLGDTGVQRAKFLAREHVQTVPLEEDLADAAADAYRRFGKGRPAAGLNFGDCFSYALAIREQVPLLFKGDDVTKTDVRVAPKPVP